MQKRFAKIIPVVGVALILCASLGQPSTAQDAPAQVGPAQQERSDLLAAKVRSKWQMIEIETASANEEWAGRYRAYDGPTVTTDLAWSPVSGFIAWWENCSRPGTSRVNHGSAVLQNGSLKLTAEVPENTPGSLTVAAEFVPVKWDAQHFLIPHDQVMKFVYAVNSNSTSELEMFLLKVEDNDKNRRGRPAVPPSYARYLGMKPIRGSISRLGPKEQRFHPKVILNVGKRAGVIPEMKFYGTQRNQPFFILDVISVAEHTSEAAVYLVSNDANNKPTRLRAGWKVSSRAPKGHEAWMP